MQLPIVPHFILYIFLSLSIVRSVYGKESIVYQDTFSVTGANTEHLSQYISYWIDSSRVDNMEQVVNAFELGKFKRWPTKETINIGLNPYPLWLHIHVKSVADYPRDFWWSLYNQADTVLVYDKKEDGMFACIDSLSYKIPRSQRKIRTRFQAIPLHFEPGEHKTIYLKIINRHTPQYFVTDFTTPVDNLLWEKDFYWSVGIFVGCFVLMIAMCLLLAFFTRQSVFWVYTGYLLLVFFLILYQELLITSLPKSLFLLLQRIHPLLTVLIALSLHSFVINYVVNLHKKRKRLTALIQRMVYACLAYSISASVVYFIFVDYLSVRQDLFVLFFYWTIGLIFLLLLCIFCAIVLSARSPLKMLFHLPIAILVIYFNPASYYLNYEGIIHYYQITYPNYFYGALCLEFVVLGAIVAWRYRKTLKDNYRLLKERTTLDQQLYARELEIQGQERKKIAQDLHDDLGTTLSAIRLIVTNNYTQDKDLLAMISRANSDLRLFLNQLAPVELKEQGLFFTIANKIDEVNRLSATNFMFIPTGEDKHLPTEHLLPAYRTITELLTNVLKHAQASESILQCIVDKEQLLIILEDNGSGYHADSAKGKGMGLDNIDERVNRLKGNVHVSSNKSGTTTIITIPL